MKQTLTTENMIQQLTNDENANWTYNGARALIEYLEQIEEDSECEIEFDLAALRCEFTEYRDIEDLEKEYDMSLDDIRNQTTVLDFEGGVVIGVF